MQKKILTKKDTYLSIESTKCLKGIFAILVLIHHLYQYSGLFQDSFLSYFFQALGYLSVAMFFFYTGYGITISSKKKGYIKRFGCNKILPLYGFYICLILFYTLWQIILQYPISITILFQSLIFGNTIVPLGWYLQVTFIIYFLLWGVFAKIKSDDNCIIVTGISLVVYSFICANIGLSSTWYESVFCVLLGMVWAMKKKQIDYYLNKFPKLIIIINLLFFIICLFGFKISPLLNIEFKMLSAIFFATFITSLSYSIPKFFYLNRITKFFGDYSLEIYISQGFFLLLRKNGIIYINESYLFICIVVIGTLFLMVLMKKVYINISSYIKSHHDK